MSRALLDTSVLLLPPERLRVVTAAYDELAISVATVGEVEHGLLGAGTDWPLRFRRDLAHRNMLRLFNSPDLPFHIKDFSLPFILKKEHIDKFLREKKPSMDISAQRMYT